MNSVASLLVRFTDRPPGMDQFAITVTSLAQLSAMLAPPSGQVFWLAPSAEEQPRPDAWASD
jgi:hypothetical protein